MRTSFKWLALALKNVLRNKRRSIVTILITAIGVTAILVGGGFANFTYEGLREMAVRESGHLIMAHKNFFIKQEDVPMQYGLDNHQKISKDLKVDREIRYLLPRIQFTGLVSNGEKSSIFIGTGVDPEAEFKVRGPFLTMVDGAVLSRRETVDNPRVVIGIKMAESLNVKLGDVLTLLGTTTEGGLNALDVTVQGMMSTGVPEMDKRSIYVHIRTAQEFLQTDLVSTLSVYLRHTSKTDHYHQKLSGQYIDNAWQTWLEKAFYYIGVKGIYDRIFGLLGVVILVMVFFSISNTVSMSVLERTREIGTFRAMGTYQWEINRGFTFEGMVIGLIGAFCGALLGLLVSVMTQLFDLKMPPPPGRSEGYPLVIDIPLQMYLTTVVLSILVCMLAAWWSARKASAKSIVDALAHV